MLLDELRKILDLLLEAGLIKILLLVRIGWLAAGGSVAVLRHLGWK